MGFESQAGESRRRNTNQPLRLRFEVLEPREMLAVADLSGWAGVGNTSSPNNYSASTTSAGGAFDDRRFSGGQTAAYLADTSLAVAGGVLSTSTVGGFGATGTITIDASIDNVALADPVFYFGFFDKDDLTKGAFGFSPANSTTSAFRFRASASTTQTAGNGTVVSDGTYTFDLDINNTDSGANTVRFRLFNAALVTVLNVTVSNSGVTLQADSFGLLQPLAASAADVPFGITISNVNYTGDTQVATGPALPGDYNDNVMVDAADFIVWRKANGTNAVLPGDSTPGTVNQADYVVWKANFGNTLPPPAAPSNLVATAAGTTQINLNWADNASSPNNETGFKIDRATNNTFTNGLTTITVAADAISYSATSLAVNTTYYFRVRAINAVAESANSNTASATTSATSAVNISATNYSRTQIYHGSQAAAYLAGDPSWTSWVGAWIMPNGDLMMSVTQLSGREKAVHNNPAPYNYTNLDVDVVYLRGVRATDGSGNVTWTKVVESDVSFTTAADSGLGTHANNSPTTIALTDGSLIRRVYGWDYGAFPNMPGTTFLQRSTDGGLTWSAAPTSSDGGTTWSNTDPRMAGRQQFLLDPNTTTVQMTRTLRLSDGRLLMGGAVWNAKNAQSGASEPLLMVSSDEAVSWQRVTFSGPAYNANQYNEWDIAELDNGDLFILSRPVSNNGRYQGIMTKTGATWQLSSWGLSTLPHSGHPELLKTQEGPVLQFATTGTSWTNNPGSTATWNTLVGGTTTSRYYPHSLQTADGWVYVFGHLSSPGGDDNYGGANQRVDMDKFKLVATPAGAGATAPGTGSSSSALPGVAPSESQKWIGQAARVAQLSRTASINTRLIQSDQNSPLETDNTLATTQNDTVPLAEWTTEQQLLAQMWQYAVVDMLDATELRLAMEELATDEALSDYDVGSDLLSDALRVKW